MRYPKKKGKMRGEKMVFSVAIYTKESEISKIICSEIRNGMYANGCLYEIKCYDSLDNLEWDIAEGKYYHLIFSEIDPLKKVFLMAEKLNIRRYYSIWFYLFDQEASIYEAYSYHPYSMVKLPIEKEVLYEDIKNVISFLVNNNDFYTYTSSKKYYHIPLRNIIYVKSEKKRVTIKCQDKESIYLYDKVDNIEKEIQSLCTKFIRVHKSYLVNVDYVYKYESKEIEMMNGEIIPISGSRKKEIRKYFLEETIIPKKRLNFDIEENKTKKCYNCHSF